MSEEWTPPIQTDEDRVKEMWTKAVADRIFNRDRPLPEDDFAQGGESIPDLVDRLRVARAEADRCPERYDGHGGDS